MIKNELHTQNLTTELGLALAGVVCLAIAIPVAIVVGPFYGGYRLHKRRLRRRQQRQQEEEQHQNDIEI
jgi:H+/gluconate symporter-like permease